MQVQSSQSPWEFLVVCQDNRVHKALAEAIQAIGGIAHHASDTASALSHITRRKLDGIFIDTRTEGALGLVGNVRRGRSNRFSVIFACAGEDEEVSRLLNAGVSFVVHKPLDTLELESVLRSASPMIAAERERYERHPLALPVVLTTPDKELTAITFNICRGGMAVRCSETIAPGFAVEFALEIPGLQPVRGRGEVAWSNNTQGLMGVRFYLMDDEVKKTFWRWMEQGNATA
jgi:hypothetical protein